MSSSALGPGAIAQATGVSSDKAQAVHAFLTSTGDEAVFACSATKLSSGTDRLVLVSRYRLLLVRWKFRRAAFRELRLLDLRGITCEGDAGAWGFADNETAQIKSPKLMECAKATLKMHALITLCLDVPPLALTLPKHWGALGFDVEGKEVRQRVCICTWIFFLPFRLSPFSRVCHRHRRPPPARRSTWASTARGSPCAPTRTARRLMQARLQSRPQSPQICTRVARGSPPSWRS